MLPHPRRAFAALAFALVTSPILIPCLFAADLDRVRGSVVRIVNHSQRGNWAAPWDVTGVSESSGTGFVVDGGLVMTNAHVVSDSRLLLVQRHNDPETHVAEVVHVAHDADLALIRPLDPAVVDGVTPLAFGEMPPLGATVATVGYPIGGLRVSYTRGVVSRIDQQLYAHSGIDVHVAVQTDAAINPGNSGGPVVFGDEVVGVAFQSHLGLDNVGYFIPPEVVQRFLRDIADGRYDGYPELGVYEENLINPAFRAFVGMREDETGVRVQRVLRDCSSEGLLREGDVLLAANGKTIASDGTVDDGDSRVNFGLTIDRMMIGERVSLRVLRDGERIDVEVPLQGCDNHDGRARRYDALPRYLVYAGLVFVPLELETLETYGNNWRFEAPSELIGEFFVRPLEDPRLWGHERVVLLRRLNHPVNADFAWYRNQVVERVNGRDILDLDDLVEALGAPDGRFHVIEFSHGGRVGVLDRENADAANDEILQRYGIAEDRRL